MRVQYLARAVIALFGSLTLVSSSVLPASPRVAAAARAAAAPVDERALPSLGPALLPDDDPFYKPPAGFENKAPGTILRSRPIIANFFSLPNPVASWQLLYRTTAVDGSAIAAVTTVFKPLNALLDRFVSYATAYDASATRCNPSYWYRLGSGANVSEHGDTQSESIIIQGYLLQGYIVSSPDYEGPDAAFTPGRLEGQVVLDNMRAVTNFRSTLGFLVPKPAIFGQGYSGGAIATGWAAALQPSYAPELPVKGWAHGGTPANLTGVLVNIDNTDYSGFLAPAVVGLASPTAYGAQLNPLLASILTDRGREVFEFARTHCMGDDLSTYANISLFTFEYQNLGPALLQNQVLSGVLARNILGVAASETPTAPVLVYHSRQDEIIPYANASALVDRYCARKAKSITFTSYDTGSHMRTAIAGVPAVYGFAASAFAGTVKGGCNRNTVPATFFDVLDFGSALAAKLGPILPAMQALLNSS